jgi:hypothetical protein
VCLHPIHLSEESSIQIEFSKALANVKLWWIKLNVEVVPVTSTSGVQWSTGGTQQPGFYAVATKGASGYTATVSVVS